MTSPLSEKDAKDLIEKLKEAREKLGLTQEDVAKKTGIDVTYYARIEQGRVNTSWKKLNKIFKALNLKIS